MLYRTYVPGPPLLGFVDLLWLYEGRRTEHARERLLPTGTVELVFNLRDDVLRVGDPLEPGRLCAFRGAVVSGPHAESFVLDTAQQASTIGVHFRPGGAFPFLGPPAGELFGAHVSLDDLWGSEAARLRDRLVEAPTPEAKFLILERALLAQAVRPVRRHPAVVFALDAFRRVPHESAVREVAREVGVSPRWHDWLFRITSRYAIELPFPPGKLPGSNSDE